RWGYKSVILVLFCGLAAASCGGDDGGEAAPATVPSTTVAVATTSAVTTAGPTTSRQPDPFVAEQVVAGDQHVCALTSDGSAYCWGYNGMGQLGDGTTTDRKVPTPVSGTTKFTRLAAGRYFTCGLTSAGATWCWGDNSSGQLGNGATGGGSASANKSAPGLVVGGVALQSIVTGQNHVCGLNAAGAAYCWGSYPSGQLGNALGANQTEPGKSAVALALKTLALGGDNHTCGLAIPDGTPWCWGNNTFGQLGDGKKSNAGQNQPSTVTGGLKFTALALGRTYTCGLVADGSAYCWGSNTQGQLGDGTVDERLAPVKAAPALKFASLTAGDSQTCGVTADGAAHCWGSNAFGQLGNGTSGGQQTSAVAVSGGVKFASLSAGEEFTCGVATDKTVYCWGSNRVGWLGDGTDVARTAPTKVKKP
ncbi:MAG: RCC1 repeat-containing protein, partial [Acidimicrobiales bacterium]